MKYLKLFENFDDNKGYELISSSVYYDIENIKSININDKILDIIKNKKTEKVKSLTKVRIVTPKNDLITQDEEKITPATYFGVTIRTFHHEIAIDQVEDYYYFVGIDDEIFYKCDQDEGLLELLKELGIIYE